MPGDWPQHLRPGYSQDRGAAVTDVDHRTTAEEPGLEETMREQDRQVPDGG
ncbi:hypothetical protein ABZX98_28685 [Streptomyces sp. NPDC002992]|uniref:hypothetical protein n=1 Tax=Streptomyces sp. NPDC002992 TaxID=3154273 RepID=UPI0033AEDBDA